MRCDCLNCLVVRPLDQHARGSIAAAPDDDGAVVRVAELQALQRLRPFGGRHDDRRRAPQSRRGGRCRARLQEGAPRRRLDLSHSRYSRPRVRPLQYCPINPAYRNRSAAMESRPCPAGTIQRSSILLTLALGFVAYGCGSEPATAPTGAKPKGPPQIVDIDIVGPGTRKEYLNSAPTWVVAPGETAQFRAIANFDDGSRRDVTGEATWASSNYNYLSAAGSGQFTGQKPGTAAVIADIPLPTAYHAAEEVIVMAPDTYVLAGQIFESRDPLGGCGPRPGNGHDGNQPGTVRRGQRLQWLSSVWANGSDETSGEQGRLSDPGTHRVGLRSSTPGHRPAAACSAG